MLWRLLAYLLGVILVACVVSPPLYWAGTWLAESGFLTIVKGFPFHRYFSRSVQISALVLLWPAFRWIGICHLCVLGIEPNQKWKSHLAAGFLIALLPVLALGVGYVLSGLWELRNDWEAARFLRIVATASAVSVIEEFLFRGVFLGLCLLAMRKWLAISVSALVFALVHFLKTSKSPISESVGWGSGFAQISMVFSGAPPWPLLGWGIFSLTIAGVVLAWATIKTRSLFLPIGLHAGWILGQQGMQLVAALRVNSPDASLPWVGPNVVSGAVPTGLVPSFVLIFTLGLVVFYLRHAIRERH